VVGVAKERLISIAIGTLGPAIREQPSREATEYQGCPVALQGYRKDREAAQKRSNVGILPSPSLFVDLRALKQVLHARCVPLSTTTRRWDAASIESIGNLTERVRTRLLSLADDGQDVRSIFVRLCLHGFHGVLRVTWSLGLPRATPRAFAPVTVEIRASAFSLPTRLVDGWAGTPQTSARIWHWGTHVKPWRGQP
jgi:hypothetical protein